jgi:hypothetical protein
MSGWCQQCHPHLTPPQSQARSCRVCLAWGVFDAPTCKACRSFARTYPVGHCRGCDRDVPVSEGYCRLCRHQARILAGPNKYGPSELDNVRRFGQQLFLAETQRKLWLHNTTNTEPSRPPNVEQARRPTDRNLLAWPIHQELFTLPPDVIPSRILDGDEPRAAWHSALVLAADRLAETRSWTHHVRSAVANTLEALVATHEAGIPAYRASSVTRLSGNHRNVARTLEILGDLGMIVDDRQDQSEDWVRRRLAALPEGIRSDVLAWVGVLRHGDRRNHAKAELTWKNYLQHALPVLREWSSQRSSLREITRDDVIAALQAPAPSDGDCHTRVTALRSLFRYLKVNKRIFNNPTSRLPRTATSRPRLAIPIRLPDSALAALAATEHTPAAWLVIVLTGHHALGAVHIQALTLDDVDVASRRLRIGPNTRPLDALTAQAFQSYLAYRNQRWPYTANPHLLITQQSAHTNRPVSRAWIRQAVRGQAATLDALRQDRILDEATAIGVRDPLHVAAMFALHPDTAQRYVDAVHGRHDPQPPHVQI